jgi:LPS-assembly protein
VDFRYALTNETKGHVDFFFNRDLEWKDDLAPRENRYAFFIEHQQKLPYDFYLKGDINHVSDHQYFVDYRNEDVPETAKMSEIDSWSLKQLRSVVFGGKDWDNFSFVSQGAVYDDFTQESNDGTVQKLPQISFYAHPQSLFKTPLFYDLTSSYTHFWRERGVEAHRGDFFPSVSYPVRLFDVLKFESDIGLRETVYNSYNDPTNTYRGWKSRQTLEANAQMSAEFYRVYDAETFSKISDLFKVSKWMHTIEPTISYEYSPRVNQNDLPNFDEVDRIPYTNQITYGVTQRLLGKPEKEGISSGPIEYAKLKIFQSYSIGDPSWFNSLFIDQEGKKRSFSNIQGELWFNFNPYVSAHWDAEFNPYRGSFDILNFLLKVKDQRNDVVQVQFRDTKANIKEINLDTRVKTIPPLYLFGAYYYNLFAGTYVQSIVGAEYQAQCCSVGFAIIDKNRSPNGAQRHELSFHAYVNLLNLGSAGYRPYLMSL